MKANHKETGVLFNGPMVRAINSGDKWNTRRMFSDSLIKKFGYAAQLGEVSDFISSGEIGPNDLNYILDMAPYGKKGDLIWVREDTVIAPKNWGNHGDGIKDADGDFRVVQYLATHPDMEAAKDYKLKRRPSFLMPKWACRTWLEITDVRVERLQDISEEGAKAEGAKPHTFDFNKIYPETYRAGFEKLWISIYGQESWGANPWVFAYSFKKIDRKSC